jgi:UDP-glucose 4-epimerase
VATNTTLVGRRALVTGAAGFIGSALCRRLASLGVEVHGVSRSARNAENHIARWWQCNLEDLDAVRKLVKELKPQYIIHLASNSAGSRAPELVVPIFQSNLHTTVNLLSAANEVGCQRILLTGSMEEPDPGVDWPIPSSPYAAAKFAAGTYGRMFHALYDMPVVLLRVFMVYGPNQRETYKLIPYVTLSLLRSEVPNLSSGNRAVDWIYIDDVVEGFIVAAGASGVEGSTLDIGTGRSVTVRGVVEVLTDIIRPPVPPVFGTVADRPMEQVRVANVEDSYRRLGWRAKLDLRAGLHRTVEWYQKNLEVYTPQQ